MAEREVQAMAEAERVVTAMAEAGWAAVAEAVGSEVEGWVVE